MSAMANKKEIQLPRCFSCSRCGLHFSSFRATCPGCGDTEIMETEGAKTGKIIDFVPVIFPPENLKELGQYVSVLVKLDSGCQLFGILCEEPESVTIGSSVVISSYDKESRKLLFRIG